MTLAANDNTSNARRANPNASALLEGLVAMWGRDAALLGQLSQGGRILTHAAEALEFGLRESERAAGAFEVARRHPDRDTRAFAGLRRAARRASDSARLASLYEEERHSPHVQPSVWAALGLCQQLLREGGEVARVSRLLKSLEPQLNAAGPEAVALHRSIVEDVLVMASRPADALLVRRARVAAMDELGEDVAEVCGPGLLMQTAALAELITPDESDAGFAALHDVAPDEDSTRMLLRSAWRSGDIERAARVCERLAESEAPMGARARARYTQAMMAFSEGDAGRAAAILAPVVRQPGTSPMIARSLVDILMSPDGFEDTELLVDALGAGVDAAGSAHERAWMMTEMSRHFDQTLQISDAAVEFGHEALAQFAGFHPAMHALEGAMSAAGMWAELASVLEDRLAAGVSNEDGLRLHDQLAELYLLETHDGAGAERHLRAALSLAPHLPSVRRLARLLSEQHRWDELYEHLMSSVARLGAVREKVYLLEQAGDIAQSRLRSPERAIRAYRMMLTLTPEHSSAMAALGRLLSTTERWEELLELNEVELGAGHVDTATRTSILCRSAEIYLRHMGDTGSAEACYRRALEDDPTFDEALRGYVQILTLQRRRAECDQTLRRAIVSAGSMAVRARLLLWRAMLLTKNGRPAVDEAIDAWTAYAEAGAEERANALPYLDGLYGLAGDYRMQLAILDARSGDAETVEDAGRIAFRMAATLEWRIQEPGRAFEHYVSALDAPSAVPFALDAIDRLWEREAVDDAQRSQARIGITSRLEEWSETNRRHGMLLLWERADDSEHATSLLRELRMAWPDDLLVVERACLRELNAQRYDLVEELRQLAIVGPVDAVRASWSTLDRGEEFLRPGQTVDYWMPLTVGFLKREAGIVGGQYEGAHERELFARISAGALNAANLLEGGESETALRLAILAGRVLSERKTTLSSWEALATSLTQPWRALRAWLDLAAEEGVNEEARRGYLRRGADLRCFDCPLRVELYDAFAAADDTEGMVDAIGEHLENAPPEPELAARLSWRRGKGLEQVGRRHQALEALQMAVVYSPADGVYALEKARLEVLLELNDDAKTTLEDCLDAGCETPRRLEVLGRLADLHLLPQGDRERAISVLEEAYSLKSSAEWGVRLASAHEHFGAAARAVELLRAVLPMPVREDDIRHWQSLSRVLAHGLNEVEEAESLLWLVFDGYPSRANALSGLEEFYRRHLGAARLAERLGEWLTRNGSQKLSSERLSELWFYLGELSLSVLKAPKEAEMAYAQARDAGDRTARCYARLGRAISQQPSRGRSAAAPLLTALNSPGLDGVTLKHVLSDLDVSFAASADTGRLSVVRQVRRALGESVELVAAPTRKDPTRKLEPATVWELLGTGLTGVAGRDVAVALAPLAEKVLSRLGAPSRALKGRRVRPEDGGPFEHALLAFCDTLGTTPPRVVAGDGADGVVAVDLRTVWAESALIEDEDEGAVRFWAGYCAGLHYSQSAPYSWGDRSTSEQLLAAVVVKGVGRTDRDPGPLGDSVGSLILLPQRRAASAVLAENLEVVDEPFDPGSWGVHLALRTGLLACSDAGTAMVQASTQLTGSVQTRALVDGILNSTDLRELLVYALGERYQALRYESGLGPRPV
jgi:tetratricopeptide (TPR) repeat protein